MTHSYRHLIWRDPSYFILSGFGAGLSPKAPGTMGTVVGFLLYPLFRGLPLPIYLLLCGILFLLGSWLAHRIVRGTPHADPQWIVFDEMVGYWIAMAGSSGTIATMILAFALFRFFDILKPWPISWCDKRPWGGLSIMLDDAVAGIFTVLVMMGVKYFFST